MLTDGPRRVPPGRSGHAPSAGWPTRWGRRREVHRQMARHEQSVAGMPPLEVSRGIDGGIVINDGVTRATRVAKYLPGTLVTVEVTGVLPVAVGGLPTVRERL